MVVVALRRRWGIPPLPQAFTTMDGGATYNPSLYKDYNSRYTSCLDLYNFFSKKYYVVVRNARDHSDDDYTGLE